MSKIFLITAVLFLSIQVSFAQNQWERTGGPIGGLGYNVKIHPDDKNLMFVTDVFSGVNKSVDGGLNWVPANTGIDMRTGQTGDAIPVFALTIDPFDSDEIWVGTQGGGGIYKSMDKGLSYSSFNNGIEVDDGLTIRNFTVVKIADVKTVFMSGELNVGVQGDEFSQVKGVLYKTSDGGQNWVKVWEGNSLARWLEPIPTSTNPDRLILATGIFDREAFNVDGEGILVSDDDGQTWINSNTGISNSLFIGGLVLSPSDANLMLIATGNNNDTSKGIVGGVYKTTDAGATWTIKLGQSNEDQVADKFTAIQFSSSDANIVYAANEFSVHRSSDAGESWTKMTEENVDWGSPGVRAGFPIEMTIDADDPDIVFINNYGGGVFKSTDAGVSWITLSNGYTGAQMHHVSVSGQDHNKVASIGRSGPFLSDNGGKKWNGIAFGVATGAENYSIQINPNNDQEILISDEHETRIVKSTDGGQNWEQVFQHPDLPEPQNQTVLDRHGAKELTYAPSDPTVVYAGFAYQGFYGGPSVSESNSTVPSGGSGYDGFVGNFENSFGIVKSTQGGAVDSWVTMNNGLGGKLNVSQIRVDSEDPDKVIISLRSGGIYKSIDGATNWTEITNNLPERNISSLDISKQNSDVIYAGTRFYGVYKSINGGTTWDQVLAPILTVVPDEVNSLFGAVAVHPTNADIVMVADWWSGIYLTTDGGNSWDLINTSLSTRLVKDIEFSADGKFVYAGTTGEGVFRMQYSTEALIESSTDALAFGTVNITENSSESFNLDNYGNASLTITGFNFSGTGFTVSNPPSTISAGTDMDITVNFVPTDEINFDQTLTVQTSIGDFVFELTGDGEYLVCSEDLLIIGESSVCGVVSTTFDAGAGFDTYQWFKDGTAIDGATSQTYSSDISGSFTVRVVNTGACAKLSAAHVFTVNELPGTQISVNGADLTAPSGATYQWFRDGNEISGETNRTTRAVDAGVYTVEVTSSQGCSVLSEPVTATPILESGVNTENLALVYPNPSNGVFKIQFPNPNNIRHELNLVDAEGKSFWFADNISGAEVVINKPNLAKGVYIMQISNKSGNKYTVKILVSDN
jgi:photosystem II stability/assembly factor-like uncharacterized protein